MSAGGSEVVRLEDEPIRLVIDLIEHVRPLDMAHHPAEECPRCVADALVADLQAARKEISRLADRAVCSGCGQDTDEGGVCRTTICDHGEMIPSSDLPGAFLRELESWRETHDELSDGVKDAEAERDAAVGRALLAGSELDWLIGYLSETDEHAAEHARRARAALAGPMEGDE